MKYINTRYGLFDSNSFTGWLSDGITGGDGKISIPAETTKLYFSMELYTTQSYDTANCWPVQIYFSDGAYNTEILSTVQLNVYADKSLIYLKTNEITRLQTPYTIGKWHKVYLVIDTIAGTIDFYLDGDKVGTYTEYVQTGVKAIGCKIKLAKSKTNSSVYTKARNIIISDHYFSQDEEIIFIPATVTNNGFSYDNNSGYYSTETENSTLQLTPDLSVLDGYRVTACNVFPVTQTQGDTIKNLKCDMGDYSKTNEIRQGMYFDNLPTSISNITITAKK